MMPPWGVGCRSADSVRLVKADPCARARNEEHRSIKTIPFCLIPYICLKFHFFQVLLIDLIHKHQLVIEPVHLA